MAEALILAQFTEQIFTTAHVIQLNQAFKRITDTDEPYVGLIVHKVDVNSLRLIFQSDSSFTNLPDLKTQLSFVILLSDATKTVNGLQYRSYRCKRVVIFAPGAETHAFANAFDASYAIRCDLQQIIFTEYPILFSIRLRLAH